MESYSPHISELKNVVAKQGPEGTGDFTLTKSALTYIYQGSSGPSFN
jgi:hypothetical protein